MPDAESLAKRDEMELADHAHSVAVFYFELERSIRKNQRIEYDKVLHALNADIAKTNSLLGRLAGYDEILHSGVDSPYLKRMSQNALEELDETQRRDDAQRVTRDDTQRRVRAVQIDGESFMRP